MIRNLYLIASLAILPFTTSAQTATEPKPAEEKSSNFTFTGSIDGYFRSDFSKTSSNNRTSFTNSNGKVALGMLSAKVDYTSGKFSATADLGAGKRAKEFAYNDNGILAYVKQLNVSFAATDWLKFTAGTWATHVGYELVDAYANRNYSMSYMFSYGPFLHTGLKSDLTFGSTGIMVGIANPTDYRKAPDGNKKSLLLQVSQAITDDIKVYVNYVGGQRPADEAKIRQFDVVLTATINNQFNLGYNGTINSTTVKSSGSYGDASSWSGSAVYLNYDPAKNFGLTLRSEVFGDKNQLAALGTATSGGNIFANTISGNIKLGGLTVIPELRFESSNSKVFFNKDGAATQSNGSFLIALAYKF
jgi:hypothetical protein